MRKEVVMVRLVVIPAFAPRDSLKHEKPQSGLSVSSTKFESSCSRRKLGAGK